MMDEKTKKLFKWISIKLREIKANYRLGSHAMKVLLQLFLFDNQSREDLAKKLNTLPVSIKRTMRDILIPKGLVTQTKVSRRYIYNLNVK